MLKWQANFFAHNFTFAYNKFSFGKDLLRGSRFGYWKSTQAERKTIRAKCEREHVYRAEKYKNISRGEKDEITKEENENIHLKSLRDRRVSF